DPTGPDIPPSEVITEGDEEAYEALMEDHLEFGDGDTLMPAQRDAVVDGLSTRVHLVHGPPGTGKTTTTAMAVLFRILDRREEGDRMVVTGSTHQAVNTLLSRIQEYAEFFGDEVEDFGFEMPSVDVVKVSSSDPDPSNAPEGDIDVFEAESNYRRWNQRNDGSVLIIGGTVSAVLKDFRDLDDLSSVDAPYQVRELVVDEASMMVFPHFLALSTIVEEDGYILLSGDHRQLSPIVAHEWEEEDRPPIELYQPYASAFEAVRDLERDENIAENELNGSALQHTFRLPPAIRALIRGLYQSMDELELHGEMAEEFETPDREYENPLEAVWDSDVGLFLIAHDERESRLSNNFEATLTRRIIESGQDIADDS
ncbi:MAG: AAA domain-containing protein, partial [Halobacteriaceae archaeon]